MENIWIVSVMVRHLNSVNYFFWKLSPFGPNPFMFDWHFIDSDNLEGQRSNVSKYPLDYLTQPPGKSIHCE